MEKILKFDKRRAFNKAVGPGKKSKIKSVGPMFIPDYRVNHFSRTDKRLQELTVLIYIM